METISNTILGEVKIVCRRGSSEKKKEESSGEIN